MVAACLAAFAMPVDASQRSGLRGEVDLTKRNQQFQPTAANMDRVEFNKLQFGVRDDMTSKRFATRQITPEVNPLGQRRAPISTGETREKRLIRPEVRNVDVVSVDMAPQNRRMAYLRNQNNIREKKTVSSIQESRVTNVKDMVSRHQTGSEPSMRDLNRFSFQRNHSDASGVSRQAAGSEKPSKK